MAQKGVSLKRQFLHVIFSPKGELEGAMLAFENGNGQIVFDRHDEAAGAAFAAMHQGQTVVVTATAMGPSPKGKNEHPVFELVNVESVDGEKLAKAPAEKRSDYEGTVVRLNYARHGAANGVVLDTGDFIHLKPEGMAKLALKVGDKVAADGDAHFMVTARGWAVEATRVNGKPVKHK